MAEQLWWYEGPATGGRRLENIPYIEYARLQKIEDDMLAKQANQQRDSSFVADVSQNRNLRKEDLAIEAAKRGVPLDSPILAALGTKMDATNIDQALGVDRRGGMVRTDSGAVQDSVNAAQQAISRLQEPSSAMQGLDFGQAAPEFSTPQQEPAGDTSGMMGPTARSQMQQQPTARSQAATGTTEGGGAMGAPQERSLVQKLPASMQRFVAGIPEDLIQGELTKFVSGAMGGREFIDEVTKLRTTLYKANEELSKFEKQEKIKGAEERATQAQRDAAAMDRERAGNATQVRVAEIGASSRENVAGSRAAGQGNTREDRILAQIDKTLRNDYIVKQRTEQLQYAQNTLQLLQSDNPVANQAAKTQLARLSGEVGVLTDKDVERYGGSKALTEKVNQAVKEAASGRLSKANQKFLSDVAQSFATSAQSSLSARLEELGQGQADAFEIPYERVGTLVDTYSGKRSRGDAGTGGGTVARVSSQADYDALPAGSQYYDPNGNLRRKK